MSRKEKIKLTKILVTISLFILVFIFSQIFWYLVTMTQDVNIKYLPGIENDFFNGFIVNGIDISDKTILSSRYLFFSSGGSKITNNSGIVQLLDFVFVFTFFATVAFLCIETKNSRHKFLYPAAIASSICIVFYIILFSLPMNKSIFQKVFDQQIYDYFGRDFFDTDILKQQLDILRNSIIENLGYYKYLKCNIPAVIISSLALISILSLLAEDFLYLKKQKKTNVDPKKQEIGLIEIDDEPIVEALELNKSLAKEPRIKIKKAYYLTLFISTTILSIFTTIVFFWLIFQSVDIREIPGVEKDYFNGFVNENGQERWLLLFYPHSLFSIHSDWGLETSSVSGLPISFMPLWVISFSNWMGLRVYKKGSPKREGVFASLNVVFLIIFFNIFIELSIYFKPDIYEIAFRKTLFFYFEKNYLISTVGIEILDLQIGEAAKGLESLYDYILKPISISILVLSSLITAFICFLIGRYAYIKTKSIITTSKKVDNVSSV
ncbi:hypothetical protein [Spiroplasma alleghenense]|uniref:Uncharacterized protein n=1 Tax=Spiroplasma alleghenense TaxID=216931 RepID=A0A345Z4M3_9MOLU|nr:hypothetical protein [Spiroplasma alleghenense]AXK51552.1 hypothetical protein SALLE_v1c08820 [Spiroplasma alleghenense]